jgi:hypothetical protein
MSELIIQGYGESKPHYFKAELCGTKIEEKSRLTFGEDLDETVVDSENKIPAGELIPFGIIHEEQKFYLISKDIDEYKNRVEKSERIHNCITETVDKLLNNLKSDYIIITDLNTKLVYAPFRKEYRMLPIVDGELQVTFKYQEYIRNPAFKE